VGVSYPPVVIVNREDKVIGWAPTADAWATGLIHRITCVVVEDSQGRILLQKRAPGMKISPGRWDVVSGHVDVTPDYEESARLELQEELGIKDVPFLEEADYFYCDEPYDNGAPAKRFTKVFVTRDDGGPGQLGEDEVSEARWFTRAEIEALHRDHPERIAESLWRCLPVILEGYEDHRHQAAGQAGRPVLDIR
jgi:isopentenyldiphosphate isomerase